MKKMILLPLLASGLMAACSSSSSDSKKNGGGGGDGAQGPITEQSLTETKWCTITVEKLPGFGDHNFDILYRVTFAPEGLLKLQRYAKDGGMEVKEQKQVTCHQDGGSRLSCNDIGKLDYEMDGDRLRMYTYDDKGQRHPVTEDGGIFRRCTTFEDRTLDNMNWN